MKITSWNRAFWALGTIAVAALLIVVGAKAAETAAHAHAHHHDYHTAALRLAGAHHLR